MGRKPTNKDRNENPKRRKMYILKLKPIFYEFGLQLLSMDDICEKLNVSKATLYNYFTSKREMVAAILATIISEIETFEPIINDKNRSFLDRYFTSLKILSKSLTGVSNKLLSDIQVEFPELWQLVKEFKDDAAKKLEQFYIEGKVLGILTGYSTNILVLSDKIFFEALTEPKILIENNLTIESAFYEYFKLKCFGMINRDSNEDYMGEALSLLNNPDL